MGRSSYNQSISTSTRTFQTKPVTEVAPAPTKPKVKLPKAPKVHVKPIRVALPANRTPWIIAAVFALITIFMFVQYREAQAKLNGPQTAAANQKQIDQTLQKVSKLVVLPAGEQPSVVTVSNAIKLAGQSFFTGVKNGDKVIIYQKAHKAILYRPSTNQIVNIGPIATSGQ